MKKKLKKKELEKVSGGFPLPGGRDTNQNGEGGNGAKIALVPYLVRGSGTNQQSGGNPAEGKVTPK